MTQGSGGKKATWNRSKCGNCRGRHFYTWVRVATPPNIEAAGSGRRRRPPSQPAQSIRSLVTRLQSGSKASLGTGCSGAGSATSGTLSDSAWTGCHSGESSGQRIPFGAPYPAAVLLAVSCRTKSTPTIVDFRQQYRHLNVEFRQKELGHRHGLLQDRILACYT
jgi:hypothetical protein